MKESLVHFNISITLKTTIAKNAINSGTMLISREQAVSLFHDFDADRISFKDNNIMSVATPRIPSWGALIVEVAEITPAELLIMVLDSIVPHTCEHTLQLSTI